MSLTRGFTRWFSQFIHLHKWGPWHVRKMLLAKGEPTMLKFRNCEVCGQEQIKALTSKEKGFWS